MRYLICTALLASVAVAPASSVLYSNSFEPSDNAAYVNEASLPAVDSAWSLESGGTATILAGSGANDTAQFVRLGDGAVLNRNFTDVPTVATANVVWVEGYFRGAGSTTTLAEADYPTSGASAIVHFSQANGIELGNGTGDGTAPTPVSTGVSLQASQWYRITLRLDFGSKKWDAWIIGEGVYSTHMGLGFVNNSVNQLNGFKNLAQESADFDSFRIVSPLYGDANGDEVVDSADLVALAENMSGTPDPIFWGNSDLDGNNMLTIDDEELLVNLLLER